MKGNNSISVIFKKENWTLDTSKKWLKRRSRKFKNISDVDETETSYRFRQIEPDKFTKYRTIKKKNGIDFVIGYSNNDNADSAESSKEGGKVGLREASTKFLPKFTWAEVSWRAPSSSN